MKHERVSHRRNVVIINHSGGLSGAHADAVFDSTGDILKERRRVVLPSVSTNQTFSEAVLPWFWNAKQRGYRTVCLGDVGVAEPSGQTYSSVLPDASERFSSLGVDVASCVYQGSWDAVAQDLRVLEECLSILGDTPSSSSADDTGPLFMCVNLVSCMDIERIRLPSLNPHPSAPQTVSLARSNDFDPRRVPPIVSSAWEYVATHEYLVTRLRTLMVKVREVLLHPRLQDTSSCMCMMATRSLSIGEHGFFGTSPMSQGTQTLLSWTCTASEGGGAASDTRDHDCIHPVSLSSMTEAFVRFCFGETQTVQEPTPVYPIHTKIHGFRRVLTVVNGRLYACVDDRVFDLHSDPLERRDVRLHLRHVSHKLPPVQQNSIARSTTEGRRAPVSSTTTEDKGSPRRASTSRTATLTLTKSRVVPTTDDTKRRPVAPVSYPATLGDMTAFDPEGEELAVDQFVTTTNHSDPVPVPVHSHVRSASIPDVHSTVPPSSSSRHPVPFEPRANVQVNSNSERTLTRIRTSSVREREQRLNQQHR